MNNTIIVLKDASPLSYYHGLGNYKSFSHLILGLIIRESAIGSVL